MANEPVMFKAELSSEQQRTDWPSASSLVLMHAAQIAAMLSVPEVSAFLDFAFPPARPRFAPLTKDAETPMAEAIRPRRAKCLPNSGDFLTR
jgi:hypothetical protein